MPQIFCSWSKFKTFNLLPRETTETIKLVRGTFNNNSKCYFSSLVTGLSYNALYHPESTLQFFTSLHLNIWLSLCKRQSISHVHRYAFLKANYNEKHIYTQGDSKFIQLELLTMINHSPFALLVYKVIRHVHWTTVYMCTGAHLKTLVICQ